MSEMLRDQIKKQAIELARENKKAEPEISKAYWFPDDKEVRLIELEDNVVTSASGYVEPFYFDSSPSDSIPVPSGIAIIRTDEYKKIKLPENWGNWEDAEELEIDK
jgi:hypothetical protein